MSHELRTPLNAILGFGELMLDGVYGEVPDRMRDPLERMQSNGKHLLGLINDVLDLSKIEAGQLSLSLADYSVDELVRGVYGAVESLAAEKKLSISTCVPPGLPPARGDERRLAQALLNLVGNAIKFTDTGEVAIEVAARDDSLTFSVRDTGPGIAEADQAKIFEEFRQVDGSITKTKMRLGPGSCNRKAHCRDARWSHLGRFQPRARGRHSHSRRRRGSSDRRRGNEQDHTRR